jgi:hypothetical protein
MINGDNSDYEELFGSGRHEPTDSGLTCPITGGRLMSIGYERHVMDPDSFYQSENDPTLYFASHPFSRTVYRLVERPGMMERAIRYFVLNDDISWTEHVIIESGNLVPIDTPQDEIDAVNEKYRADQEERRKTYEARVASGEIVPSLFPTALRVLPKMVSAEQVEVKPMEPPKGMLFYLDTISETAKKIK